MPIFGEKPFTSITVKVNQLCNKSDDFGSIELYLGDLLSLISLQSSGATEAARAIRKNIKYGNSQLVDRALTLLELLVLNGGIAIGKTFSTDDKLLHVLKVVLRGSPRTSNETGGDKNAMKKMRGIALGWKYELKDIDGLQGLATLYKAIPTTKPREETRLGPSKQRVFDDELSHEDIEVGLSSKYSGESEPRRPPPRPKTLSPSIKNVHSFNDSQPIRSHKKDKKKPKKKNYADTEFEIPQINYKVEAPKIRATIADCQTHATALKNSILSVPKESDASQDANVQKCFKKCRTTRRAILRYLQFVGAGNVADKSREVRELDEEFLGSLIAANEQLVNALTRYDEACGISRYGQSYDNEESSSDDSANYITSGESSEEEDDSADEILEPPLRISPSSLAENFEKTKFLEDKRPIDVDKSTEDDPFGDPFKN
ncbi:hypothetical protein PUMCH_004615 [Australozyma saopauloensis]|uniref:VHS domain-containing protein n=1 Tax=Australozyma saopauloensis TaxID=291208 RepID=A0AAX4HFR7_9ASCO|nr:hypothetical protein PUMCH_004615 [[Candida] saopauloensis]